MRPESFEKEILTTIRYSQEQNITMENVVAMAKLQVYMLAIALPAQAMKVWMVKEAMEMDLTFLEGVLVGIVVKSTINIALTLRAVPQRGYNVLLFVGVAIPLVGMRYPIWKLEKKGITNEELYASFTLDYYKKSDRWMRREKGDSVSHERRLERSKEKAHKLIRRKFNATLSGHRWQSVADGITISLGQTMDSIGPVVLSRL